MGIIRSEGLDRPLQFRLIPNEFLIMNENISKKEQGGTLRKGYLDGPYGQIHYYEQGKGPCLILCHQSPVCGRAFERAIPFIAAKGFRVIAVDTPGFGNSDAPSAPPTIDEYSKIFPLILSQLNEEKAHFLGHHTGASIVCALAVNHPEIVQSLILNGPALLSEEDLEAYEGLNHGPEVIERDGSHLIRAWNRRVSFTPGWTDKEAMHRRLIDHFWSSDTTWHGHYSAFQYKIEPAFLKINVPCLILTNTGDDIYHLSQKAKRLRPDMDYVELIGGTHDIVDEQPEAWANAVVEFIKHKS